MDFESAQRKDVTNERFIDFRVGNTATKTCVGAH